MNPFEHLEHNSDHIHHGKSPKEMKRWSIVGAVAVAVILFYAGFMSGQYSTAEASKIQSIIVSVNGENGKPEVIEQTDFSIFWKAWNLVDQKFVQTKKTASTTPTTGQDRVYGAIKGMVDSLGDPYTTFFPPTEAAAFETEIEGNFEGVGMEMGVKDGILTVVAPLKGSPAEKAGILSGDKILEIDGKNSANISVDEAVKLIRGKRGTSVKLTVIRDNNVDKPLYINIVREVINLPTIDTKYDQRNGIFTIKVYSFSGQAASLFRNALRDFVNTKSNKLIIDLRGNPGGFLDAAVDMASWFLSPGKVVVTEDYGNGKEQTIERSKGYNIFSDNLQMVILIDGGSASASEIFAGALSEHGKAKLVGTKSFGKGSVQEYIKIDDKTSIKITVAKWLTPNGKSISDGGLTPDIEVKLSEEDLKNKRDAQMDKAIEILTSK